MDPIYPLTQCSSWSDRVANGIATGTASVVGDHDAFDAYGHCLAPVEQSYPSDQHTIYHHRNLLVFQVVLIGLSHDTLW